MATNDEPYPLVSVVLPTYDRPGMVVEAVESVAAQRYPNVELIVVDDASPTPVREALAGRSWDGLDVRCLRHATNRGANAARNTGIREADGEFVAFIDDDDRWEPQKLAAQMSLFREASDDAGVALVGQRFVDDGEVATVRVPELSGDATRALLTGGVAGTFSAIAVRRSTIDAAGLPDERFPSWQDREWLIRLSRHAGFVADPRPLVTRRSGDYAQISDDFERKRDVSYPLLVEKHRDLAAEHDCERRFVGWVTASVAVAGLNAENYDAARKHALDAIRIDPRIGCTYVALLLSLVPPRISGSLVRLRRLLVRAGHRARGG